MTDHCKDAKCACRQHIDHTPLTTAEQHALHREVEIGSLATALKGGFFFLKCAMLVVLLLFILDRFRSVNDGEIMVVERFGELLNDENGALRIFTAGKMYGLFPEPIDHPIILRTAEAKELNFGLPFFPRAVSKVSDDFPATAALEPLIDGYNLTGDLCVLHTHWKIKYRITNYRDYLLATQKNDPEDLLAAIVNNAIIRHFAGAQVDRTYHDEQPQLFARIDDEINARLATMRLGVELDGGLANQAMRAPGAAQTAFNKVASSLSEYQKSIDEAHRQSAQIMQAAETAALAINNEATHYKIATVARARADAVRIRELTRKFAGDQIGLKLYLAQYRYDRLRTILSNSKLYFLRAGQNIFWTTPTPEYSPTNTTEK